MPVVLTGRTAVRPYDAGAASNAPTRALAGEPPVAHKPVVLGAQPVRPYDAGAAGNAQTGSLAGEPPVAHKSHCHCPESNDYFVMNFGI
jgi:hypothetical protein